MKALRAWADTWFRKNDHGWLLIHKRGEYVYRNPDSVYIHRWEAFATREEAIAYLDDRIPRADRDEWRLYQAVPNA